jgi:multidrug efflux pump subunit AcrB
MKMRTGISGYLTLIFIDSKLTPLLLAACLMLGVIGLIGLPREEEPQISVPMVDILIAANGYKAPDAAELITRPLEDIVKGIDDVEHVYSQTSDDAVVAMVRFKVGTDIDTALMRVHEKIRANITGLPQGIPEPLIVGRGIDDVPIVTLTLASKPQAADRWDANALHRVAVELQHELIKTDNIGLNFITGGAPNEIRVEPDPERLALFGVTLNQLADKLTAANRTFQTGAFEEANKNLPITAGQSLTGVPDIGLLLLTTRDGRPVYVKDVAKLVVGGEETGTFVNTLTLGADGKLQSRPAVTLAFAKRKGANAVTVANDLLHRLNIVRPRLVPADLTLDVTRNYGATATEKADELLFHLGLATLSIVLLITWAIGKREGLVVLVVIPTTILLTLFAAWAMGATLNRVSLFALIFSIGILVDDAIVIVENIVRRWQLDPKADRTETAIDAVSEVGNPTIVATLTIVTALLPMMAVSGLMGPYMSPIPVNASLAMLFSFFVAEIITPWLLMKVSHHGTIEMAHESHTTRLHALYLRLVRPLVSDPAKAKRFLRAVTLATLAALLFFPLRLVTVKLLPFDNKSEIQVVLDGPEGSTVETTNRTLAAVAEALKTLPELVSFQTYAGTAAPFNFNGLVRHSYLRALPQQGDLQINLKPKNERSRASHAIALDIRARLAKLSWPERTRLKVVEVPPGPPVLATLLAEIYGPDAATRRATAALVRDAFAKQDFITDIDDSYGAPAERLRFTINQENLEYYGVDESAVFDTLRALTGGVKIGFSHRNEGERPVPIALRVPRDAQTLTERLLATPLPAGGTKRVGKNVELGDVVTVTRERASYPLFRHNGRYAEMVQGELAGRYEAPIYGMLAVDHALNDFPIAIRFHGQPDDESHPTLLWDGEWEITYTTFRDMGAAFAVALAGIYLLVVGLFKSFRLPLLVLVPVPLTLIGIILGHALFGAPFTATSMIGFIALAGIIVRNSILLIDFIQHLLAQGMSLPDALVEAGLIRLRPIVLTSLAAMIGAAFILADPIFQGLALSLVFGLASSTALTMLVIPALYTARNADTKQS